MPAVPTEEEAAMKPESFPEANRLLTAPSGDEEHVQNLPVLDSGEYVISQWRMSLRERLRVLVRGRVWLWVRSNAGTQPPVCLDTKPIEFEGPPKRRWLAWLPLARVKT